MAIDLTEYNGIIDNLLLKVKEVALEEYTAGRIKDTEYGTYLSNAISSVIGQSGQILQSYAQAKVEFESINTSIQIKSKQLESIEKDIEVKERTTVIQESEFTDKLLTTAKERLSIDKDIEVKERTTTIQESQLEDALLTSNKQRVLLDTEALAKQYEVTNILPANLAQILKQTDVAEREMDEKEATGLKQRVLLDEEKETADSNQLILAKELAIKTYENSTLQIDQHNANAKQIELFTKDIDVKERAMLLQESELTDKLLTSSKERLLIDKDIDTKERTMIVQESQLTDSLLTTSKERLSIDKDIDIKERTMITQEEQLEDTLLTSNKQRESIEKDISIKTLQALTEVQNETLVENNALLVSKQILRTEAETIIVEQKYTGRKQ